MCEANACFIKDGEELLMMKSVDVVEPESEESWRLMFGVDRRTCQ
jgi:hypothetical protein